MEDMKKLKMFTVQEANELIPKIIPLIQGVKQKRDTLLGLEVEIDALELVTDKASDGSSPLVEGKVQEYNRQIDQFYALVDQIQAMGCYLKDIELGLVDFYTLHEGRVVYLCWKFGETNVSYWHEVGRGFGYRQPLDPHHPNK